MAFPPDRARLVRHLRPFHWREAALCLPAMPLLAVAGAWSGFPVQGATAAGAAFAVGFGAARELRGRRWAAMALATLGMAVVALVGCVTGGVFPLFAALAALFAAGCAALALWDEDLWWVALQVVIAFLVAGYFHGTARAGLERAAAVLGGGEAQIAVTFLLARLFPRAGGPLPRGAPPSRDAALIPVHMARAALCVVLSLLAARALGLANSYWAPMTALIVLKPRLRETRARGLARLTGTLAGCFVATLYAHGCGDRAAPLVLGMTAAAGAAFALQKAHYASLTAAITATVVLLLSLGHAGALANAEHRLAATLLGGVLALLAAAALPHRLTARFTGPDRVGR